MRKRLHLQVAYECTTLKCASESLVEGSGWCCHHSPRVCQPMCSTSRVVQVEEASLGGRAMRGECWCGYIWQGASGDLMIKFVRGNGSHRVVAGTRKGSKSGYVRVSSEGTSSDSDDTWMIQIRYLSKFGSDCGIFCEVEKWQKVVLKKRAKHRENADKTLAFELSSYNEPAIAVMVNFWTQATSSHPFTGCRKA